MESPKQNFPGGQLCKERFQWGNPRVGSWISGGYDEVRAGESFGQIQSSPEVVPHDMYLETFGQDALHCIKYYCRATPKEIAS